MTTPDDGVVGDEGSAGVLYEVSVAREVPGGVQQTHHLLQDALVLPRDSGPS